VTAVAEIRSSKLGAYLELGKLRLSSMAIFAVLAGLFLGSTGIPGWSLVLPTIFGTLLVAVGGNALNMYLERDTDPAMRRTQARPLPSGRLTPLEVLICGIGTSAIGLGLLFAFTNLLATALCAVIGVTYVLIYTPMKRRSSLNTLVGAVPGALPPVVGYAAGKGHIDEAAVVLFFILFFWQIPHFLAIAWRYRDDYERAGMQMLPVIDPRGRTTAVQMMVYCVSLVVISVLPSFPFVGLTGQMYLYVAVLLGFVFLIATFLAAVLRKPVAMRQCFLVSIIYLPLLFTAMVVDNFMQMRAGM
jgi:protoheme IX farnesyltransferase